MIVDASVLVAAANDKDPDAPRCRELLRLSRATLIVPSTALAEATFLVQKRLGAEAEIRLVSSLAIAPWMVEGPCAEDLVRSVELMQRFVDLPLGFSDAASVALAERLKETTVASLDNHFRIVRPNHIDAFTVVP